MLKFHVRGGGWLCLAILGALILAPVSAPAFADENFETVLGPTPINHVTRSVVTGEGAATAVLTGNVLKVNGAFDGLPGAATDAHLMMGSGIGIPGASIFDLTVTTAATGTLSGAVNLSRPQIAALHAGKLYIQINSQKAPAPGGNLWGWLLPEHKKAGQDEPQLGDWFLPQGKGLKAAPAERQS